MDVTAACIDVTGSSRAMDVAYLEKNAIRLHTESNLNRFFDWVRERQPQIIAIDAPSKENAGLVPALHEQYSIPKGDYENFRIAEAVLRIKGIGLYNTPRTDPPSWMKRGWDLYSLLRSAEYSVLDDPGKVEPIKRFVIEVHPHASFVVGLGWIPQSKQTLAGQLERSAYLRKECSDLGLSFDGTLLSIDQLQLLQGLTATWDSIVTEGICLPLLSHDQLDAIVGLTTAIRALRGEAVAVGHQSDGVIVLPKSLDEAPYQFKHK